MKVFLFCSHVKDENFAVTKKVTDLLITNGASVYVEEQFKEVLAYEGINFANAEQCLEDTNFVISIGGDGTFLKACAAAVTKDIPIFGINLGHTGFLAEIEIDELEMVSRIFTKQYQTEHRMMLHASVVRDGRIIKEGLALNDVVFHRGMVDRLLLTDILSNGEFITSFRGDGLIVTTPTGSSGYSLSAGGPIIDPKSDCIVAVPICPHSLTARSIVFGKDSSLTVAPVVEQGRKVYLSVDGVASFEMERGDTVLIKRAEKEARIAKFKYENFFKVMKNKFKEGDAV